MPPRVIEEEQSRVVDRPSLKLVVIELVTSEQEDLIRRQQCGVDRQHLRAALQDHPGKVAAHFSTDVYEQTLPDGESSRRAHLLRRVTG